MIGGGSRSTTPVSLTSRKSPTTEMAGSQSNKSIVTNKDINKRTNQNRGGPRERRDSGRDNQSEPRVRDYAFFVYIVVTEF